MLGRDTLSGPAPRRLLLTDPLRDRGGGLPSCTAFLLLCEVNGRQGLDGVEEADVPPDPSLTGTGLKRPGRPELCSEKKWVPGSRSPFPGPSPLSLRGRVPPRPPFRAPGRRRYALPPVGGAIIPPLAAHRASGRADGRTDSAPRAAFPPTPSHPRRLFPRVFRRAGAAAAHSPQLGRSRAAGRSVSSSPQPASGQDGAAASSGSVGGVPSLKMAAPCAVWLGDTVRRRHRGMGIRNGDGNGDGAAVAVPVPADPCPPRR